MPGLIMVVGTAWKRTLYLSFLFLLVALKQRIVAVPPSSPTSVLGGCCWHREAKSFSGLHSLATSVGRPANLWGWVCVLYSYMCAHTYPRRLNSHCQKPFCQLHHILPFTDGSQIQNGCSYFKPLILKMVTHNTEIIAMDFCGPSAQCSIHMSVFLCYCTLSGSLWSMRSQGHKGVFCLLAVPTEDFPGEKANSY